MRFTTCIISVLILHYGCMASLPCKKPTMDQTNRAYYGVKPEGEELLILRKLVEVGVKTKINSTYLPPLYLKSLNPYRGWIMDSRCRIAYGYIFSVDINTKNVYGEYAGSKTYKFLFLDGRLRATCSPYTVYSNEYNVCSVLDE